MIARRTALAVGLIATLVLVAACGSSSPSSTSAPPPASPAPTTTSPAPGDNLTGLGATDATWNAHHVAVNDKTGMTYGAFIPIPGAPYGGDHQWTTVGRGNGRITHFTYSLPEGTPEASAKQAALAQLPRDATTTTPLTVQHDSMGNSCSLWNLRSPTLARVLGPPPEGDTAGDIGIDLYTYSNDGEFRYDPNNIDTAVISDITQSADAPC